MEKLFDDVKKAFDNPRTLEKDSSLSKKLAILKDYYSKEWRADYERDERGELPKRLKRGVLSQDGLYDLLDMADSGEK